MEKNDLKFNLFKTLVHSLINFISHIFLTYSVCELITIIFMSITGTQFEALFIQMIRYTPTLGIKEASDFRLGVSEIITFFAFWSLILTMIHSLFNKLFNIKISNKILFIIFTSLHMFAAVRLASIEGLLFIILFFYLTSLISYLIYKAIRRIHTFIELLSNPNVR